MSEKQKPRVEQEDLFDPEEPGAWEDPSTQMMREVNELIKEDDKRNRNPQEWEEENEQPAAQRL